jgi:hypothetical protein
MAKRSQSASTGRYVKKVREFFSEHPRARVPTGFGQDYSFRRELPVSPPTAYYLRRYSSFWDSLKAFRADRPEKSRTEDPAAWAMVPYRQDAADRLLTALRERTPRQVEADVCIQSGDRRDSSVEPGARRDNYEAAERALLEWCEEAFREPGIPEDQVPGPGHQDPRARVAWEIRYWLHPLLWAYANPKVFFNEVAPQIDSNQLFDSKKLMPDHPFISHGCLAAVLHTWGYGALLNDAVRIAFEEAAKRPEELSEILADAEGKGPYVEGPPAGATKGRQKKRRVDNLATKQKVLQLADEYESQTGAPRGGVKVGVEVVARREGRTPNAIRQRIKRATKK